MPRYLFGEVEVDTDTIEIVGPDGVRPVEPQVFDVVQYLIEQTGRLVTKEELLDNVWGNRFVSESALTPRIKQARRVLGDDGRTQWAIKTIHGRGYRFVPTPELVAQSGSVLSQEPDFDGDPAPLPDELLVDTRHRFVGRKAELEQSTRVLARPREDRSFGCVWLLGEPGIGKTRLAAEVALAAQARGHRVLFGRNNEDLQVPYQPFIEALRSVIDQVDLDERGAVVAEIAPELSPLLPGVLTAQDPTPVADNAIDNQTRRYRLFEALTGWLETQAAEAPLTMIIDDLHWAAESTLQFLAHLQQRVDGVPINFVVTARDTAPDMNPRVADLLAAGQGKPNTTVVRLAGLSPGEAGSVVGKSVASDAVMLQTAGNPLLLQAINPDDGSVDIKSAVHRRLAKLDDSLRETLQAASVLGLEFGLAVAAAALRRDELDLLDDLERAIAARLLDDVGVDRFRFTHALVRSSMIDELSSARRARMHRRAAEAFAELFPGERQHLLALAFHTAAAAEADPSLRPVAVERLELAAQESMSQLSFDEAASTLERALALADQEDDQLMARLTLEKGIAQTRSGASMTAARSFQEAVSLARRCSDPELRVEAALRFEDATWRPGLSGTQALEFLNEAADVLDAASGVEPISDEVELRARLAIGRLRALAMSGQIERAEEEFATTHALTRRASLPNLEASVINVYLSQVRFFQGLANTSHLILRLAELQPEVDDGDVALHAVHVRALYATIMGESEQLEMLALLMSRLQEESHSKFWRFIRTNQEAMEAFYDGDLVAAEQLAEDCLALANELPEEDGSGTYGLRMFLIRREQDQLAAVAPLVRHVLSTGDVAGVWTPGLALLLSETGDEREAAELLSDIKAASFVLPMDAMWSTVMVFLIETMVQLNDRAACATLRERFEQLAGTNVVTGSGLLSFGRADRYLGMLSFVLGELERAEDELGSALEADSAGGSVLWANESRLWLSRVRRAQGHEVEADAMLEVVARQTSDAGLGRLKRMATDNHA